MIRVQRWFVLLFTSALVPGVGAGASHILLIPGLTTQLRNCESLPSTCPGLGRLKHRPQKGKICNQSLSTPRVYPSDWLEQGISEDALAGGAILVMGLAHGHVSGCERRHV